MKLVHYFSDRDAWALWVNTAVLHRLGRRIDRRYSFLGRPPNSCAHFPSRKMHLSRVSFFSAICFFSFPQCPNATSAFLQPPCCRYSGRSSCCKRKGRGRGESKGKGRRRKGSSRSSSSSRSGANPVGRRSCCSKSSCGGTGSVGGGSC